MVHILTDDEMFGPTSLDGAKPFFSQFNLFPTRPPTRGAPPFRKGDMVTQTTGPHMDRNRRCQVDDVAYVTNSEFTGWAIRLVGRSSPYAAEHFAALTGANHSEVDHEVRVEYLVGARAYRVTVDGDLRFSLAESVLLQSDRREVEARISAVVGANRPLVSKVYDGLARTLIDSPPTSQSPAAPPEPAPTVRRRIVRRNKK
jgi:hypothetical protein